MKTRLSFLSVCIIFALTANSAWGESSESCGNHCVKTEHFDATTNRHEITLSGTGTETYHSPVINDSNASGTYKIVNHVNWETSEPNNTWASLSGNVNALEFINHGNLIGSTLEPSPIYNLGEAFNITNNSTQGVDFGLTNYGTIKKYLLPISVSIPSYIKNIKIYNLGKNSHIDYVQKFETANFDLKNEGSIDVISLSNDYDKQNKATIYNTGKIGTLNGDANDLTIINDGKIETLTINSHYYDDLHPDGTKSSYKGVTLILLSNSSITQPISNYEYVEYEKMNNVLILQGSNTEQGIAKEEFNSKYTNLYSTVYKQFSPQEKFHVISDLKMQGKEWTLSEDFSFMKSIQLETGILNTKEGSLTAPKMDIDPSATLRISDNYVLNLKDTVEKRYSEYRKFIEEKIEYYKTTPGMWNYVDTTSIVLNQIDKALSEYQSNPIKIEKLTNSGTIDLTYRENNNSANTLTINGDYHGNNGVLKLTGNLLKTNNPEEASNKVIFNGNVSGTTFIDIAHFGNKTEEEVTDVEIAVMSPNANATIDENSFKIRQPSSDFIYSLKMTPVIDPVTGQPKYVWLFSSKLNGCVECAVYSNNLYAANNLFVMRLEDRLGRDHFLNQDKAQDVWIRVVNGRGENLTGEKYSSKTRRTLVQIGGDVVRTEDYKLGAMFGYAKQHSDSRSTNQQASGKLHGYALGLYGTWTQAGENKSGAYVDGWLQYQWFNNQVNKLNAAQESYRAKGLSASLEAGYHFAFSPFHSTNWLNRFGVQPQLQVIWQGVKAQAHTAQNSRTYVGQGSNNLQTRLGLKFWLDSHHNSGNFNLKPYFELNLLHNSKNFGTEVNGKTLDMQGTKNVLEYKAGLETHLGKNLQIWTALSQQNGSSGFSDKQFNVGAKFLF